MKQKQFIFALVAMLLSFVSPAFAQNVAKVGNTEYATIDEAIANWSNNTTLTLLADVTLSDVIQLSSTEHHILDLGTYTMTAASRKDAIQIVNNGRSSASYALDIKADATNPGGITASGKAVVKTTGKSFYFVEGLELFGNPEDMVIDATNKFILPTVAIVNGQEFSSFTEALEATKTMTGDVTVEIYDKVTFNQPLIGNYTSIKFVGKDTDAEMYLDVQGYTTATGKKVSFTDLKLSKSEGGFIANAGFMNVAFGIYDVEEVTYNNCTFLNGACASSGKVTFNGCTFKKSWDKYGLWAYGNVDVTVQGSTFADYRGIKMYAENGADASVEKANLTVKNTNFSAVDNKPAIVLTYGESVVLEGNTYSSTGTFELDLDGKPNGVAVTSDVAPVCVNDNGACGVLVDGKIYTTVAQAAEVATEGSKVTLLHDSKETVEFPEGVVLNKNGNEAAGVTIKPSAVKVATLAELQTALAADNELPIIITAQIEIPAGETVEFDLNGKTVNSVFNGNSTTNHIYALSNKGTLTIQDSKGNGSINSRGIYNYGSLTLNAGAINAIDGNGGYAVNNQSGSTFVMNGGVVAATNEDDHQSSSGGYDATTLKVPAGCTATLNGGTINNVCDFTYAIEAAGTLNIPETSTITVNGTHGAIYVSGGTTTINAGTFQIPADEYSRTDNVLYVSGGELIVNGGTFIGDSDTASGGSCLCDTKGTAVVNGGTFKGSSGGDVWGTTGTTIKGGTFENLTEKQHIAAGYELKADGTVAAKPVAEVNGVKYASFAEAAAAAQAGSKIKLLANIEGDITVPANVTLNGNGFAISGGILAEGDITFAGVTTAADFDANVVNTAINIPAGASLQLTGSARLVIGHGATFNITGTIEDAKTADKATLVPSLKIAAGASITGNGVTFNVNNAYIVANANTTSKNSNANGTLDFNINNSIWDQTGVLAFYVPTSGKDPVVNFELKNSVLTTTSHLVFSVTKGEVVIDNSNVNVGKSNQIENRSTMTIKNGSVVNGAVATSSNAINPGTIIVDNATYAVTGEFSGAAEGKGTLVIKKGANVSVGSIKAGANVTVDAEGMAAGDEINFTANLSQFTGELSVINNDKLEAQIVDGKVVLAAKPVAKIGEQGYATLEAAFAAAAEGQTITLLGDATPALTSQRAITKAAVIDLGGKTLTLTEDDLYFGTTTFKNGTIVVDPSVKASTAVFWMFANQTLTFDNVKIVATGVTGTYLIGLDGNNSDLNLLNGSEILVENTTALDLDIICVNASTGNDIKVENSKVNVTNLDGRVFFRGNYTVAGNSEINLEGITKAGFRIEAGQTLTIKDNAVVNIVGEPRDGGIHMTDITATYTKAGTATVNATVNEPKVAKVGENTYRTLAQAVAAVEDGETLVITSDITPGANEFIELNGKTNVTLAAAEGVVINGDIQVGYHPSHVDAADRSASTFTVDGLTVKGTLTVCSNDAALVVKNTKAAQITVKTCREGMDIALNGNTADGSMGTAANGYGMFILPNATGYNLTADGNTFKNINSHAFVIQGCGDGSAKTAANSIVVRNNTFESWGTGGKSNRAAFKIWADTKYAPVESGLEGTTNAMRELVDEIAASNNTYSSTADNTVEFDAYGAAGDAADFPAPMYPVAKIGEQGYETLAAALDATKTMTGDVTVEILDKVTFNQPLIGSYSSINFVGKAENAEMYLDVQGYTTATGKEVTFTDLKLSKSVGGYVANAGFMNLAFGIYDVKKVTYNNCTFINGACASSGDVTFNGCTFYRSHDRYGLWAYGAPNVVVDGCTFADIRGIKLWDEGKQKLGALTVKNTDFSAVDDKPAIVLTSGKSVTLAGNTYNTAKGALELDLDGNPNGTPVTSDVTPVCVNDNGACGVLVDGKIYTTVAQAAKVATSGSNVKLLHNSAETVELAEGVVLDKNGFEAAGVTVYVKPTVAKIGDTPYYSLAEALEDAKTKNLSEVVITIIGENTAATADKFNLYQASVFNKVTFKQENGNKPYYFEELYTGSRTDNGQFVFDGVNLVVTGQGQYIFEGNVVLSKNSLIKSTAEANCFVYNAEVTVEAGSKIDGVIEDIRGGSLIIDGGKTDGTYCEEPGLRDAILVVNWVNSNLVLRNGAYVNINAANEIGRLTVNGTLDVANSKLESYQWIQVNENGTMKLKAGSDITTNELKGNGNITIDATDMAAGDVVLTATTVNFTGTLSVINNDKLEAKIVDGKIVLAAKPVAKVGINKYYTLEDAFKAATDGCTIDIVSDVTVDYNWDARYTGGKFTVPVTINGNGKTIKFTASVNDNNYQAPFRFEADATVKNLTIDMSEVTDNRFRAISSKGNLTVDKSKFIGKDETLNCRAIIFGEGAGANVGNLAISITNSEFINWKRGITDNENAQDVKTVTITGNTMTDAGVGVSAKETVTFTGNTVAGAYVNIKSYTAGNKLAVTATGNTLEANTDESGKFNVIDAGGVVNAEGFKVVAKGNNFNGYTGTDGIWGEVWGNARESFVIKVLDANDNVMGTTSLNNVGGIIDGDVNVSWNLKFNAAANTDEYWTMEWTTAPTLNNMPAKVELWVDGTRVGGGPVVLNGPDDLNKINVIVTDAEGKVTSCQTTVANALAAAKDGETVNLLWKDGQAPLAMNGSVFGKNVTIAGTAKVDWNKGFLFVGRGGAGNATVTFDGANLTSASNSSSYGIHVSGREKNTTNKYDGTLVIKNSTIELDYLINRNAIELDNATLTVKNGFAIAGRPASETENAANATATISLANGSKVVVNNHNGMGLGQAASVLEGFGVMSVDATSAFETTQGFVVTVNGTMNIAGNATIAGTLTNEGAINLASENATLKAQAGLTINSTVEGRDVIYADGVYTTKLGLKGKGTEAEPYLIYNVKELVAFRNSVNEGETKYSAPGVYVALAADIDMTGENWVGIGSATADHGFMGNFDGKNFKIKNLTINNPALDSDGYAYAGLFGVTEGTDKDNQNTIKNLTIENVTINTTGDIVSAAIAYPYYTIVDNVKVCGNIAITGGNYTAGVLAYTRRCVNASNLAIVGNNGSYVKGNQTVGGVISDIQMNGGLTAVYSNFSAVGITVTGEKSVGGIAGIIATQTLNGATVKNVTLNSTDEFAGVVAGRLGGTSTISNVVSENVTGATAVIGATFDGAKAVAAKIGDTYYATLEAALAAQGNEVELLATYEVAAGETKTLDLMGKTVIGTPVEAKAYAVIINKGNLTITGNGSVICNHTLAGSTGYAVNTITNGGTLTIDGATIENKSTAQYQIGYAIDNNSTTGDAIINIKAGKVIASGSSYYDGIRLFCNSITKKNDVIVSGGEVSTIWMQNPSDGAEKNTKDVAGNVEISGGKVGVLSLEPSANFEAAVTGGHIGEISYFQTAEGRDLVQFVTGGSFDNDVNQFCALGYQAKTDAEGLYIVEYTGKVAEFTIVDGEYTEFNIETPIEVGTLTYERNFSAANRWNALYVPFEIPVELLTQAGYEVAYVNDVHSYDNLKADGTPGEDGVIDDMKMEVILIKNGKLNANYPYLIRANSAGLLSLEIENAKLYTTEEKSVSCSSVFMKFEVTGIYESKTARELGDANSIYALGGGVWTLPESPNQQLKPFRLYLKATKIDGSPVVVDESTLANIRIRVAGEKDEVTGIITPIIEGDVHVNDGTVYDLMGRPVRTPEKGKIYIMNGKKVLF